MPALIRNRYKAFFKGFVVDIGEVDVIKLHTTKFLQLFLHLPTHFKGELQDL